MHMNHGKMIRISVFVLCAATLLGSVATLAQEPTDELAPSKTARTGHIGTFVPVENAPITGSAGPRESFWYDLVPHFDPTTLAWVAVVVILMLTLQTRPFFSLRNVDGLMLVLIALLLPLRDNESFIRGDQSGATVQWWVYLVLTLIALYWVLRGLRLALARVVPVWQTNVSEGGLVVVLAAGLILVGNYVAKAPVTDGSRDGLTGGICVADTGKLPYGEGANFDARSPLLYLLYGGAVQVVEPTYNVSESLDWDQRTDWDKEEVFNSPTFDDTVIRLVNALLTLLLLAALAAIGYRNHSVAAGQCLVAIACVFPGSIECLGHPEIMLPTVLLAWSVALARVPGIGGLLSLLLAVMAGVAWPWAWLVLPVLLAYFLRNGVPGLGAVVGLLGGAAAIVAGLLTLVAPSLPRQDGALKGAGYTPTYAARNSSDGALVIEYNPEHETVEPTFKSWFWKWMLSRDELTLSDVTPQPALPNGVDAGAVMLRDINANGPARLSLQRAYRASLRDLSPVDRALVAARTVIESTWKPATPPAVARIGAWDLWNATVAPERAAHWDLIRRVCKVLAGVLALLLAVVMMRGERPRIHHLVGALLVISAAVLLVSPAGAVANWVWLLPTVLAALAAQSLPLTAKKTPAIGQLPPLDYGPAPRITVDRGRN